MHRWRATYLKPTPLGIPDVFLSMLWTFFMICIQALFYCRLQPFLAFTYLMRVRKSQGAMDCNPDRNLASAHHHRHSPTLWLALSNPRHCIPSLLIQRSLSQRSREHGRNKTRWCS